MTQLVEMGFTLPAGYWSLAVRCLLVYRRREKEEEIFPAGTIRRVAIKRTRSAGTRAEGTDYISQEIAILPSTPLPFANPMARDG